MKKILLVFLVLVTVAILGCQPAAQPVEPQPEPAPEVEAPEPTPAPEPEPIEEEPLVVEPEDDGYNWDKISKSEQREILAIRKAMDKALDKEENYYYLYTGPDQFQYGYTVKGSKMRILFLNEQKLDKMNTKNVAYLNLDKNTAGVYCEHKNMNFCYDGPGSWPASVSEYKTKTPKEWLESLGQDFRYQFDDSISGVSYHIIDYTVDGKLTRAWVDSWLGYPMRIDFHPDMSAESEPTKSYLFEDMEVGGFTEDDVTPNV
ncbi:MAG: hypothetical protein ACE5DM_00425 [Candidatus Nanoarchaeia archaeon]